MIKRIRVVIVLYIFFACATEYNRKEILDTVSKYTQEGKFQRAYTEFVAELKDHFEDIQLHKEFIRFISSIHRCEDGYKFYEQNRDSKYDYIFYYSRGLLMAVCGDGSKEGIIKNFSEAVRLKPDDYEIRLRFGAILMEYEMYSEAIVHFTALSSDRSLPPSLYSYISLCEAYLGHLREARENISKVLDMDFSDQDLARISTASEIINSACIDVPDDIRDDFRKMFDLILIGDQPSATIEPLENMIVRYPSIYALRLLKGMSLALIGEYSTALYELNSIGDAQKNCSYFQYTEGVIYLGVQKEDKAIPHLEEAIRLDPLFARAYRILSEIYLNRKEYNKAENLLRIYLKLERGDLRSRFVYGRLLVKLKRLQEAAVEFEYINEREPENIFGIVGLGIVEREYARVEKDAKKRKMHLIKSLQYLNTAIKKDPENQDIKNLIKSIDKEEE